MDIETTAFFDELEKIAEESDNRITKDRLKRFVRYGLAGAAGSGLGYAAGKAVGRPLQKKLRQWGAGPKAAKFLRYAVPTTAGLGAGLALTKGMATSEFLKKVKDGEKGKKPVLPQH